MILSFSFLKIVNENISIFKIRNYEKKRYTPQENNH